MASNHSSLFQNTTNTTNDEQIYGWKSTSNDRGTIDIMWSSCVTIVLCCWVSTYPNVGSPKDKWYHALFDKLSLAVISMLGPDFLFGIAMGQFCSARRSVKAFRTDENLCNGMKWTYTHAFFVDMGGIHLTSPDYPDGFPINAEQLHYLLLHKHVEFPDMTEMAIAERNTLDTLSRIITVFQAFWFFVTEIQRVRIGLPMTTLELTALSFSFIMFATSITWYAKPTISQPRPIKTKNQKTVEEIRAFASQHTHPRLSERWYQTPLEFVGRNDFRINAHWRYYTRLAQMARFTLISRPITSRPWDRFPSDTWLCLDLSYAPLASAILIGFSILFVVAWNFHFPTYTERLLWRICSIYHACFSIYGGIYYFIELCNSRRRRDAPMPERSLPLTLYHGTQVQDAESQLTGRVCWYPKTSINQYVKQIMDLLQSWRNISHNQDPEMEVPLRVIVPVTITCVLYVLCRLYIYFEDFFSLRAQPAGVYLTVNKFIPFLVGG